MATKILIVEDEKDIVKMIEYNLQKEGFRVVSALDGQQGLARARRENPDLIVLDLMLPEIDGLTVCRELKKEPKTAGIPVIMLTAKAQEADKIVGLELGADDYLTKPFSVRELIARIKAILRRSHDTEKSSGERVACGDLQVDFARIEVRVKNKPVELTAKEFELLKSLIQAKGRVLSRDFLLDTIWGFDHALEIQTRTVDVHIRTLRKKLKSASKLIKTVKNYGYRFQTEEE